MQGPSSVSVSAYDIAPWGNTNGGQPRVSVQRRREVRRHRTSTTARVTWTQRADRQRELVRDNGFNAGVELKPVKAIDLGVRLQPHVPMAAEIRFRLG